MFVSPAKITIMDIDFIINSIFPTEYKIVYDTENNKIVTSGDIELFVCKTEKGFFIKNQMVIDKVVCRKLNKNTVLQIITDPVRRYRTKHLNYRVFIPNKGIPTLSNSRKLYLTPALLLTWRSWFSLEFITKIVKYSCPNQEWWLKYVEGTYKHFPFSEKNIPLDTLRKSNNLQQYLNKINFTSHPVSAKWLSNLTLADITFLMASGCFVHNPVHLWENADKLISNHNLKEVFVDSVKMASDCSGKITFSTDQDALQRQHDRILTDFLKIKEPVPLTVNEIFEKFSKDFPEYKLISEGNRLTLEGQLMKHCVASREQQINSGNSAIFHIDWHTHIKGYTLQINRNSREDVIRLNLYEGKGFANESLPNDLHKKIIDDIAEFNDKLIRESGKMIFQEFKKPQPHYHDDYFEQF